MKNLVRKILMISPYGIYAYVRKLFTDKIKIITSKSGFSIITPPALKNIRAKIQNGSYEKYIPDSLMKNIDFRTSIVWDIGSHIGYHSLSFASLGAMVISFEPNENNAKMFEKNMRMNPNLAKSIKLNRFALSDYIGKTTFHTTKNSTGGYLDDVTPPLRKESYTNFKEITVKADTVDNMIKTGTQVPNAMKIDVEGGEYKVLLGAKKTIETVSPILIIEVHTIPNMSLIQEFLSKYEYKIEIIDNDTYTTTILAKKI